MKAISSMKANATMKVMKAMKMTKLVMKKKVMKATSPTKKAKTTAPAKTRKATNPMKAMKTAKTMGGAAIRGPDPTGYAFLQEAREIASRPRDPVERVILDAIDSALWHLAHPVAGLSPLHPDPLGHEEVMKARMFTARLGSRNRVRNRISMKLDQAMECL